MEVSGDLYAVTRMSVFMWYFDFLHRMFTEARMNISATVLMEHNAKDMITHLSPLRVASFPTFHAYLCFSDRGAGKRDMR